MDRPYFTRSMGRGQTIHPLQDLNNAVSPSIISHSHSVDSSPIQHHHHDPSTHMSTSNPPQPHMSASNQHIDVMLQIEQMKINEAARQREHEIEMKRIEEERRQKDREHELEMIRMKKENEEHRIREEMNCRQNQWKCDSFPVFDEAKDDIDSFLEGFERRAYLASPDDSYWVTWLGQVLCKGQTGEVYARAIRDPNLTYQDLKSALLSHFNRRPEEYRRQFRNIRPLNNEMPIQFSKRLNRAFEKWLEAEDVTSMNELKNLFLVEQIMKCYNADERIYVRQCKSSVWEDVISSLQAYVEARIYTPQIKKKPTSGSNQYNPPDDKGKENLDQNHSKKYDNRNPNPRQPFSSNHNHKGNQNRGNGPILGLCTSPPLPRHKLLQTATFKECQHYSMPVKEGVVEGRKCEVLRDTGCGCIVVQQSLVPQHLMKKEKQKLVMIDGEVKEFSTARVRINSPYLKGQVDVVVMEAPVYPLIVGNVDGATGPDSVQNYDSEDKIQDCSAGQAFLPHQGKPCVSHDDVLSSNLFPAAPVEAVENHCLKEGVTLASSDNGHLDRVEQSTQQTSTRSYSKINPPATVHQIRSPTAAENRKKQVDNSSILQNSSQQTVAAAITRAQTEATKNPPKSKPLSTIESVGVRDRKQLILDQENDPTLAKSRDLAKKESVLDHKFGQSKFYYNNGLLMRSYEEYDEPGHLFSQIVLPQNMRLEVMKLAHEGLLSGHLSAVKSVNRILPHFFWPALRADVKRHCQSCDICQRTIPKGKVQPVPLGNVPVVGEPFYKVGIDLVGPLEKTTSGKRFILTYVCYSTRYPEAVALANMNTESVAEALISIFSKYGICKILHSDNGGSFTSEMMEEVCRLLNVKQSFSPAYRPAANGLVEKMNGTLKQMLRKMCIERPKDWDRYLDPVLFAYREVPNSSTEFSPFELLYGRTIRGPMAILKESLEEEEVPEEVMTSYEYVFNLRNRLEETCKLAQENLEKAKSVYKKQYDKKTKDRKFKEGDKVLLLLPTEQSKLSMQWRGPYEIISKVGQCNYRIKVNGKERLYHANMMKLYISRQDPGSDEPQPSTSTDQSTIFSAAAVIHEEEGDVIPTFDSSDQSKSYDVNPLLSPDQKKDIKNLVDEFSDRLSPLPGLTDLEQHGVELTSTAPIRSKCYHTPYATRKIIDEELEKMIKLDVIEPSKSEYAAPVVLVKKEDETFRFCCDYRKLNGITRFHAEPVPDQHHLFMKLQGAKYLSRVDLTKAFWQIPIPEADRHKTAFITHSGL